jgi:hypothetical protein
MRTLLGLLLGALFALGLLWAHGRIVAPPRAAPAPVGAHVREDGGALRAVVIHYAPAAATLSLATYRDLLRALPAEVAVHVACATETDCATFRAGLAAAGVPHLDRLRPVIVGVEVTTWSRDRFAAKALGAPAPGRLEVLAPPREETPFESRAGDGVVPFAVARALGAPVRTASFAFEGGDLASTATHLFVDVNLLQRNEGRGPATRAALTQALQAEFRQEVVFLGEHFGDVPQHHIMMYLAPLGGRRVLVGDVAAGLRLLDADPAARAAVAADRSPATAARFEHAARALSAAGFAVTRAPVVVLEGGGAYVTYTNALFATERGRSVVYLPTYALAGLDRAAADLYRALGYEVRPIDVSALWRQNGSLGCLVNVIQRG